MIYAQPGTPGAIVSFKPRYGNFINGEFVPPLGGQYFTNSSPVNGQPIAEFPRSTAQDVERALDAAHAAAEAWGKTSVQDRARVLLKIADRIEQNLEVLAVTESWDNGKAIRETLNADVPLAADHFRYFAGCIRAQEGGVGEINEGTVAYHIHEPLGVVGQIIPWNFPLLMAAWKLAPALAAGNCVVLKPAEQTPLSITVFAELIADLLPAGVLNIVQGFGREAGEAAWRAKFGADYHRPSDEWSEELDFTSAVENLTLLYRLALEPRRRVKWDPNLANADYEGENARLASLAAMAFAAARHFPQQSQLLTTFGQHQLDWILGQNPFNACMLAGHGINNPSYTAGYPNALGGICNGITAGFDDENDLAFIPEQYKDRLDQNWRWGEQYFAQQLNDFDLAANNGGWQWASSSGCDAQPYFRIFNPVSQSEKFDPEGKFIRRYLLQLAGLSKAALHAPWAARPLELQAAGVTLGHTYPLPIVQHDEARKKTLERYAVVKAAAP